MKKESTGHLRFFFCFFFRPNPDPKSEKNSRKSTKKNSDLSRLIVIGLKPTI